ncbi:restriction endonuclease subunit S [Rhodococcus pyridinivorans]|uniref:restriction endonuclease subunit S n=1 Tax=Rhodococcus pyridinivorans TaxID=103816 RepID=UPI0019077FB2|nr:restriction endonuclease subunit S [Rhodococcus pyridinivorans]QQM55679.1 restriction endonuclease subunit S [Rhodococcus pyridinivorans]
MSELASWVASDSPSWRRRRIRTLGRTASGSGFPPALQGEVDLDLPFYKVKHLGQASPDGVLGNADDTISYETAESLGATIFPAGTLVYAKVGAALMLGRVRVLPVDACIDNNMAGLIPSKESEPRFLYWAMSQVKFDYLVNPGAVPSLSDRNLLDFPLLVPSRDEQRAIANYLDRETARIDTLIEEQLRFIEILDKRRNAVITEATTKGVSPRRALVESGTGPLWDALPIGWLSGQIKNVATVTLGKMLQSKDSGGDVRAPYMRAANVQPDGVLALDDVNEMWFSEVELEQLNIRAGDVVVVEGGQGGFGRAAYVDEDLPGWGFQNSINRLRPLGEFEGRFIAFYLIALRASGFIRAYSNVVSMPHLTAEKLARIPIPLPPVEEQRAIADYLDRETARIDTLIDETERFIELARERRAALIMAAVTGQIDVGEMV